MKGSINALQLGQSLLVAIKPTASDNSKVQLEVAQLVSQPNALEAFNADDPAFNRRKPRRAWLLASAAMVKDVWPQFASIVDKVMSTGEAIEVNELNPSHPTLGQLNVRVFERTASEIAQELETTTSVSKKKDCSYLLNNLSTVAKRAGAGGAYLTFGGDPIVSRTEVVFGSAVHTFLPSDADRINTIENVNVTVDFADEEVEVEEMA
jgi:hypothetical protein